MGTKLHTCELSMGIDGPRALPPLSTYLGGAASESSRK